MNYIEAKKICCNREAHLSYDDEIGEYDVYPCKYMINYFINKNQNYCTDELEPSEEYCFKCPYRNKNMEKSFEIRPEI